MSSIKTYEDLEAEEKRLQALLYSHKENIKDSFTAVKRSLNPFRHVADTVTKLFHSDRTNPIAKLGIDIGVDILLRRFILSKAGWLTRIVVPFFVKNYSTHFIREYKKSKFLQKLRGFFKHAKREATDVADGVKEDVKQSASNIT